MRRALLLTLSALLGASALAGAAPAQADGPWWQLLSGSRPSNLQPAPDQTEVQELSTAKSNVPGVGQILVAEVSVGGQTVACLGSGSFVDTFCEEATEQELPAIATAAELQAALEAYGAEHPEGYGAGAIEVSGGPAGGAPFTIATPGRWVAPVKATPVLREIGGTPSNLGKASWRAISEGSGLLVVTATNLGDAPLDATEVPLEIADELPEEAQAYDARARAGGQGKAGPVQCVVKSTSSVSCSFEDELPPYEAVEIEVLVALEEGATGADEGEVSVSGGDGPPDDATQTLNVSAEPVRFGFERFSVAAEEQGGEEETSRAGAHPFQLTTTIVANSGAQEGPPKPRVDQPALPRNLRFTLPAGLVGSATAVPECSMADFLTQIPVLLINECPDASAIGASSVTVISDNLAGLTRLAVPVFNLTPRHGAPARFGLMIAGVPVVIDASVDPDEDYRITAEVRNVSQTVQFLASTTTIWGVPGDPAHDASRGWKCAYFDPNIPGECERPGGLGESPFLRMPTRCDRPLVYRAEFEPWNVPRGSFVVHAASESEGPLRACNRVPFAPEITSDLTSRLASSPSGQEFELLQEEAGFGQSGSGTPEAQAKRLEVTLPAGVTLNPSAAEGLATCSQSQLAAERYDSAPGEGCPQASKVGTLESSTPLISETVRGEVYVAEPYRNPFDSLIALYVVARVPERGILVRQPLELRPDERTGRIVAIADDLPQLPYESFKLRFREGGRAPLVTPPACGTFHTTARFVPWSAADPDDPGAEEIVGASAPFEITRGANGGACPSGGVPPFAPGFAAGSLNNQAGAYSPFQMRLTRKDGDQDMTRFSAVLPPGMVGRIAGVPRCPEAGIARAISRGGENGGHEELAEPSCPAASQIGRTSAGAGVGQVLTYVPGSLYLAGPTGGAPLSVVAITPAVAGPFDAGVVVVREGLALNPITAEVEVDGKASDPIPHILKGIPLKLRDLRVHVDRPDFTLNPTSCAEMATRATLFGSFADVLDPADDVPLGLAARFQAAGCRGLGFKPRLGLKLKGKPRRGGFPALRAHYKPRSGHANLRRLALTFPTSAFIEQGHFRTICTRVAFAAGPGHGSQCPKGSIYGRARVWTPLLDGPLKGPVYLRSSNHNLPDAVFALHGPPSAAVEIEVVVRIDSVKGRLRATVAKAPDAPVSRAIVDMQGGRKGLIVNSRHLCFKPKRNRARAGLRGQNGRARTLRPVVRARACAKKRGGAKRARLSAARVALAEAGGGR